MTKYAALLRGVNVGGRIIKMAELKICLEKAGLEDVETLLQSGNVIFKSNKNELQLKIQIQKTLADTFNYPAKVWILSLDKLRKIVEANPYAEASKEYHQYVVFIENELEVELLVKAGVELGEEVSAGQGVVYWKVQKGQTLKNPFAKLLTKSQYREFNTNRNINTLQKIVRK
ncbi:DUF1697 domain-containing protein [Candidatus Saccharibacteria bacterium]|jgi:uncharacterized protein (DUF1697 family)|nr:DUF1697 domain-containing protein [Candidatus Saccharibacteria bacterium]